MSQLGRADFEGWRWESKQQGLGSWPGWALEYHLPTVLGGEEPLRVSEAEQTAGAITLSQVDKEEAEERSPGKVPPPPAPGLCGGDGTLTS